LNKARSAILDAPDCVDDPYFVRQYNWHHWGQEEPWKHGIQEIQSFHDMMEDFRNFPPAPDNTMSPEDNKDNDHMDYEVDEEVEIFDDDEQDNGERPVITKRWRQLWSGLIRGSFNSSPCRIHSPIRRVAPSTVQPGNSGRSCRAPRHRPQSLRLRALAATARRGCCPWSSTARRAAAWTGAHPPQVETPHPIGQTDGAGLGADDLVDAGTGHR